MSSSDRDRIHTGRGSRRKLMVAAALIALSAVAGCTVQPLYGETTSATTPQGGTVAQLAAVEVKPENNRVGQEVRNDIPSQEFAALRAVRDAENRAARELAELLRLVVAQELRQPTSTNVPRVVSSPEELEETDEDDAQERALIR